MGNVQRPIANGAGPYVMQRYYDSGMAGMLTGGLGGVGIASGYVQAGKFAGMNTGETQKMAQGSAIAGHVFGEGMKFMPGFGHMTSGMNAFGNLIGMDSLTANMGDYAMGGLALAGGLGAFGINTAAKAMYGEKVLYNKSAQAENQNAIDIMSRATGGFNAGQYDKIFGSGQDTKGKFKTSTGETESFGSIESDGVYSAAGEKLGASIDAFGRIFEDIVTGKQIGRAHV